MSTTSRQVDSPISGVIRSVSDVTADAIELAELQVMLARADFKATYTAATRPLLLLFASAGLLIGGLPLLALGMAHFLSAELQWSLWHALLAVGAGFVLGGTICVGLALRKLKRVSQQMEPTFLEFQKNLDWLKRLIRQQPA